jgi:hypothetical protein
VATERDDAPVTNEQARRLFSIHDLRTISSLVVAIVVGSVGAWMAVAKEARAAADAGVEHVDLKTDALARELAVHEMASAATHAELRAAIAADAQVAREVQLDIRALYRRIETGEPQPRLEAPPAVVVVPGPDGGTR